MCVPDAELMPGRSATKYIAFRVTSGSCCIWSAPIVADTVVDVVSMRSVRAVTLTVSLRAPRSSLTLILAVFPGTRLIRSTRTVLKPDSDTVAS
jgi:hypothetical protein